MPINVTDKYMVKVIRNGQCGKCPFLSEKQGKLWCEDKREYIRGQMVYCYTYDRMRK